MQLRESLIKKGLRQMKSEIRMYSLLENHVLIGALIIHVNDVLYVGNQKFIILAESAIKQFRVVGTEISTKEKASFSLDWRFSGLGIII